MGGSIIPPKKASDPGAPLVPDASPLETDQQPLTQAGRDVVPLEPRPDPTTSPPKPAPTPSPSPPAGAVTATGGPDLATLRAAWPAQMRARLSLSTTAANGNRPVAVYVSPGLDPQKPVRVVTLFHGHGWDVGPALARYGVFARIQAEAARDPQTVFVLPQARTQTPFSYWMKAPESFAGLEAHALAEAGRLAGGELQVGTEVLNAHSGGGLAIANLLRRRPGEGDADWQTRLAELDLGCKVNFLDATYGDWGALATRWAIARRRAGYDARVESWYTRHLEMVPHNEEMRRIGQSSGLNGVVATHDVTAQHGHQAVVAAFLGTE